MSAEAAIALLSKQHELEQQRLKAAQEKAEAAAKQLAAEKQRSEEERKCVVCLERPKDLSFAPCGHTCCCVACGTELSVCPLCRAAITTRQRLFT